MSIEAGSVTQPEQGAVSYSQGKAIPQAAPPPWFLWNLAVMVLVSAFLLFQVQPLISKFILPWFGGSPAVWTTCMLFFQSLLFCGYAYAHLTSRLLSGRGQAILHIVLLVLAACMLPIMPADGWKPQPGMEPTLRILGLLTFTVGLPYFVLSATGPLGQAWFSRAYSERSPYRLYSLSNIGSLTALVTYPFFFEPAFTAEVQAWLWTGLFVLFGALCTVTAVWIFLRRGEHHDRLHDSADAATNGAPSAADKPSVKCRALWLALPACASLMLLATTNQACVNVPVSPFFWVIPLSLYLLTFIICFDHERWYHRGIYSAIAALLVFVSGGGDDWIPAVIHGLIPTIPEKSVSLGFLQERVLWFATMFMICMICHGELVRSRPKPRYLTEFYLLIAAGGALGGAAVTLIAPHIFPGYWEWNLGLVISFAITAFYCLRSLRRTSDQAETKSRPEAGQPPATISWRRAADFVPGLLLIGLLSVVYWQIDDIRPADENILQRRNFYGIVKVYDDNRDNPARHYLQFKSGGVSHGKQWVSDDPARRLQPTAYYSEQTGAGRAIRFFLDKPDLRIGVVGLGVGTLAAYPKLPTQSIKFYEINPEVVNIAAGSATEKPFFSFIGECKGKHEIVLGDARLSLESELERKEPQQFDVLVLDAFSGDAVPAHLLTREAFAIYRQHLKPDGIIAVNIKNRYVYLGPVVKAAADFYHFQTTRIWTDEDPSRLLYEVDFMLVTNNKEFLAANPPILKPKDPKKPEPPEPEPVAWTDHFSNLYQLLMPK